MPKFTFDVVRISHHSTVVTVDAPDEDTAYDMVYDKAWGDKFKFCNEVVNHTEYDITLMNEEENV